MRIDLSLLAYQPDLKFKQFENGQHVWDIIRQKYVRAFPEELVRQLLLRYLIAEKGYQNHIAVEKQLILFGQTKRFDILLYNANSEPTVLIECKSANVELNQAVFNQVSAYNLYFKLPYLIVCNGLDAYCASINFNTQTYHFIPQIPALNELILGCL
jgi:hypothetical protein